MMINNIFNSRLQINVIGSKIVVGKHCYDFLLFEPIIIFNKAMVKDLYTFHKLPRK